MIDFKGLSELMNDKMVKYLVRFFLALLLFISVVITSISFYKYYKGVPGSYFFGALVITDKHQKINKDTIYYDKHKSDSVLIPKIKANTNTAPVLSKSQSKLKNESKKSASSHIQNNSGGGDNYQNNGVNNGIIGPNGTLNIDMAKKPDEETLNTILDKIKKDQPIVIIANSQQRKKNLEFAKVLMDLLIQRGKNKVQIDYNFHITAHGDIGTYVTDMGDYYEILINEH